MSLPPLGVAPLASAADAPLIAAADRPELFTVKAMTRALRCHSSAVCSAWLPVSPPAAAAAFPRNDEKSSCTGKPSCREMSRKTAACS